MPQMKVTLGIGFANAKQEEIIYIDDDEWSECETNEQRENLMNEYWQDWANNYIDGGTEIIE
jgi:hypothetical protein